MKVLPWPTALDSLISPPSSLAISRLIDRPRPVPPYLRLVVPSACWNASKMTWCLSGENADAGVFDLERDHVGGAIEAGMAARPAVRRRLDRQRDRSLLGELDRVRDQVLEHLLHALLVGDDRADGVRIEVDAEGQALAAGDLAEGAIDVRLHVGERHRHGVDVHHARLDLREVENLVDQLEQVRARRVNRLREFDLLLGERAFRVLRQQARQNQQRIERGAELVATCSPGTPTCSGW